MDEEGGWNWSMELALVAGEIAELEDQLTSLREYEQFCRIAVREIGDAP